MNKLWFILFLTCIVAGDSCSRPRAAGLAAPASVFVSDNPQSIYAADPNDSWNRIFRALFTRTINSRAGKKKVSTIEIGDRAIEPLYPTFFTAEGPLQVLSEPRFSELTTALREATEETKHRSPIARALMQADVWAAYDILYRMRFANAKTGTDIRERNNKLLTLLRQFVRKLALSSDEIKALKNNYVLAVSGSKLPNLFSAESGWLEIALLPHRLHDESSSYRRVARVFVKPRTPPPDPGQFVEGLKHDQHHDQVEAVALVVQNLLIDASGGAVPSPVFSEVQFRFFKNDPTTDTTSAEPQQFELSRRKLLTEPTSGGFVELSATSPAYLSAAGNDYGFATPIDEFKAPVVVPLRKRCAQCHNASLTTIMTYSIHHFPPVPTVRILKPLDHERAFYVARRKQERDDFKSLFIHR